ncbi:hypothetical protein R3P38DRAFT_3073916 [Favolaschia claudopus]|uniref:F-box domain-containing protein n=1 Tax=Favolaschia claudopus TaxID=2862362 RepID=A0AAV9ZXS5_9AGAR
MLPKLPAELVDLILSFLHPTVLVLGAENQNLIDRATAVTLGRCGLVCRAWLPSSRRPLFFRVQIVLNNAHRFAQLLKQPHLCTFLPFIRELVFGEGIAEHQYWMSTVLPRLIPHFSDTIHVLEYRMYAIGSPKLSLPCPRLGSITHLVIYNCHETTVADTVRCISGFPALLHLKLCGSGWHGTALPATAVVPPRLQSLDLDFRRLEPFLTWIQSEQPPISDLKLTLPGDRGIFQREPLDSLPQFIQSLGSSLTSLTLKLGKRWSSDVSKISNTSFLKSNPNLQTIIFQSTYKELITFITGIHLPGALAHLTLRVYADGGYGDATPWTARELIEVLNDRLDERHSTGMTVHIVRLMRQSSTFPLEPPVHVQGRYRWDGLVTESTIPDPHYNVPWG